MSTLTLTSKFHVASAFGAHARKPFVELTMVVDGEVRQLQVAPDEAREIARNLFECAEAADMDAIVVRFMQEMVHVSLERAAQVLLEFREIRDRLRSQKDGEGGSP